MAIVVDPCLAERAAEEKNLLVSISAWKLIITVLANIMAMLVDPFLRSRIRCRRKESVESLSAWKFAITVLAEHHGDCRGSLLSRIRCKREEFA